MLEISRKAGAMIGKITPAVKQGNSLTSLIRV
jgi:hypothetical protein